MNRTILLILLFLLFLFVWIFGANYFSKKICPPSESINSTSGVPATGGDAYCGPWSVSDNDDFNQSSNRYLRFARNESEVLTYADDVGTLLNELNNYLQVNPDRSLTISGVYSDDEGEDLGLARAESVKSLIESIDDVGATINVDAISNDGRGFSSDTLCHGAEFSFSAAGGGNDEERIGSIGERLKAEPIRLYFETDAKEPKLSAQNKRDLQDIVFYLENVPSSTVEVSGHTDNVGSGNERLSRRRAEKTADYLAANWGIDSDRMNSKGYADSMPIADNGSSDGRAQNRRVEVRLN